MTDISFSYGDSGRIFINPNSNYQRINCDNNLAIIRITSNQRDKGLYRATHIECPISEEGLHRVFSYEILFSLLKNMTAAQRSERLPHIGAVR